MVLLDFITDWITIYEPSMRNNNGRGGGVVSLLIIMGLIIIVVRVFWYQIFPQWNTPGSKKWYNYFNK